MLIDAEWRVRLADFGVARLLEATGGLTATSTGIGIGTPPTSPRSRSAASPPRRPATCTRSRLVLLEALTGEPVYTGTPSQAALMRLITPPQVPDGLPLPLRELLTEMTADQPGERPPAAAVRDRLDAVAAAMAPGGTEDLATPPAPAAVTAPDPGPPTARPAVRRVPRRTLAAAAAVAAAPLVLLAASLSGDPATPSTAEPQPVATSAGPVADHVTGCDDAGATGGGSTAPVRTTAKDGAAGTSGRGTSPGKASKKKAKDTSKGKRSEKP